jgi:hypothetical protein
MKRYGIIVLTTLLGLAAVVAAAAGAAIFGSKGSISVERVAHRVQPNHAFSPAVSPKDLKGVNFESACDFTHRNNDDAIVFPKQPGKSHEHSYFGNTTTDAFSTLKSMTKGSSNCDQTGDLAGYWVPTLLDPQGNPVEPRRASIYYRRKIVEPLQPFPAGLKVIAGDSKATAPQDQDITFWNCGPFVKMKPSSTIPKCPDTDKKSLGLQVRFPDCWDGGTLDSPDHKSHFAYSHRYHCPSDHPVAMPMIQLIVRYSVTGGAGYALSSGGQFSAHADFFNAWDPAALKNLVDSCLNALKNCSSS